MYNLYVQFEQDMQREYEVYWIKYAKLVQIQFYSCCIHLYNYIYYLSCMK